MAREVKRIGRRNKGNVNERKFTQLQNSNQFMPRDVRCVKSSLAKCKITGLLEPVLTL